MAGRVEHELHQRRLSRNLGVGLALAGLVAIVFGLTLVKVSQGDNMEAFDHVIRPGLVTEASE